MRVSLVWAMSENGVIGRRGDLPWRLPDDLRHFRTLTTGHAVLMGRKTWESIGARPLPGRRNLVVTRDPHLRAEGAVVVHGIEEGLRAAADEAELFVVGGAEVFRQALPRAERLHVTLVHAQVAGDTRFPEVDWSRWRLVRDQRHEADDRHALPFSIRLYERISS